MSFKIPLFDLNFDEKEEQAALKTIRSKWISAGEKCAELERKFCEAFSCGYAVSVTNCTAALHLAMLALDIKEGDEVIVPSLTFVATANAVRYVGAVPVFADITSEQNLTISASEIESLISSRTKAIIVMHYAGFPCDMDRIMGIAKVHGLKVVEDACHAPLSEHKGKKLGSIGDIGCFSFFSNKNISTGEGGMMITDSPELDKRLRLLRSHGMTTASYDRARGHSSAYDVIAFGYNYRFDDIRASIALAQMEKLEADLIKRAEIRKMYTENLRDCKRIIVPFSYNKEFVTNYIFPIVLKNSTHTQRDKLREELAHAGIQTSIHYPPAHKFSIYRQYAASLPITEYVADSELTLPMFSSLTKEDVRYICKQLIKELEPFE